MCCKHLMFSCGLQTYQHQAAARASPPIGMLHCSSQAWSCNHTHLAPAKPSICVCISPCCACAVVLLWACLANAESSDCVGMFGRAVLVLWSCSSQSTHSTSPRSPC